MKSVRVRGSAVVRLRWQNLFDECLDRRPFIVANHDQGPKRRPKRSKSPDAGAG